MNTNILEKITAGIFMGGVVATIYFSTRDEKMSQYAFLSAIGGGVVSNISYATRHFTKSVKQTKD